MPLLIKSNYLAELCKNKLEYIALIRSKMSGAVLDEILHTLPRQKEVICRALEIKPEIIDNLYSKKHLCIRNTEIMLDLLLIYSKIYELEGNLTLTQDLLAQRLPALGDKMPNELLDTFTGRTLVKDAINNMKCDEFI